MDRAKKTLYVTGFNPKLTTKRLLEELFTQGAPVKDVTLFDTHAYVLFQHEESAKYCLALFNEIELHGQKLRISPRFKDKDTFQYLRYLGKVRDKLMTEYLRLPPPELPPKQLSQKQRSRNDHKKSKQSKKNKRNKPKSKNNRNNIKRSR